MGKLTETVFNESCCDGGVCSDSALSAQPCGCDMGHMVKGVSKPHYCEQHRQPEAFFRGRDDSNPPKPFPQTSPAVHPFIDGPKMRQFEGGATRNVDANKPDYEAFISPLVTKRYGQYMLSHRKQADGKLREGDNWQKGMPKDSYVKSLVRHVEDVKLHFDGFGDEAVEGFEESICAAMFNLQGLLFELLKDKKRAK